MSGYKRKQYLKNPEGAKRKAREWARRNPKKRSAIMAFQNAKRRSRKKANGGRGFTRSHWNALVERVGGKCAYCRRDNVNSIDHFVPLSKGGQDDYANIVPSCKHCNSWKRQHDPTDWIKRRFGASRLSYVLSIMLK